MRGLEVSDRRRQASWVAGCQRPTVIRNNSIRQEIRAICRFFQSMATRCPHEPAHDCDMDCDVTPFENADLSGTMLIDGDQVIDRKSVC